MPYIHDEYTQNEMDTQYYAEDEREGGSEGEVGGEREGGRE